MILKIIEDSLIQSAYTEGMVELNDFWEINWIEHTPDVIVAKNKNLFDRYVGIETKSWVVASAISQTPSRIIILDFNNINKTADRVYNEKGYILLIKHELCHLFFGYISQRSKAPQWLSEGLSVYLSGQHNDQKKPDQLLHFLDATKDNKKYAYEEGGFVVETLVNKFGKNKIISLVKSLADSTDFSKNFENIYGFPLTYENINRLYT